jgi:hypothetical protein
MPAIAACGSVPCCDEQATLASLRIPASKVDSARALGMGEGTGEGEGEGEGEGSTLGDAVTASDGTGLAIDGSGGIEATKGELIAGDEAGSVPAEAHPANRTPNAIVQTNNPRISRHFP